MRFLKLSYPSYRNIQINYDIDLLYNANVIDQVAYSRYNNNGPSRDAAGNQRLRIQLEANPTNSTKEEEDTTEDNRFDSSTILAMNTDRNIDNNLDDLRR